MISINMKRMVSNLYNQRLVVKLKDIFTDITTKHDYDLFCEFIENYILDDNKRTEDPVIIYDEKENVHKVTLFQFLIDLYFLEFNFMYKIPITTKWMKNIDKRFLSKIDKNIEKMCKEDILPIVEKKKINQEECFSFILSHLTERLYRLSELLAPIAAPTINLVDIAEFTRRNDEFKALLDTTLDDTKSVTQLEEQLKCDGERLYETILDDKKSCLFPFVEADCLSTQQLTQMFVAVGPRMSATNVVMAHVMRRSYLNGLQNIGDLIAESEIAAKALIYKKKFVGDSGYMSREINLSALNIRIDYDMQDCGTEHYINYNVKSEKYLDMAIGKNIILPNGKLHEVTPEDTNLIGTTVKMRSICCCAHSKRGWVCKNCYGNPKEYKKNYRIGGATSSEVENRTSNAVMSVKHSTSTKTKEFDDKELLELFNVIDSSLMLKQLPDAKNISITFDKEYIEDIIDRVKNDEYDVDELEEEEEEQQGEDSSNTKIVSKLLTDCKILKKSINPETEEEEVSEYEIHLDGSFLTLSEEMLTSSNLGLIELPIDSDIAILNLSKIRPGTPVFNIKYITADSARYLKLTRSIISRPKPQWYTNDLSTPINQFADLMVEAGLKNEEVVFLEPIIYSMTRDANDIMKRPDFKQKDPQFVVINLNTSILKGDLCSAIVYQEITKTLKSVDSFERPAEIGDGIHDSLFKTTISHDFGYMKKALKKAKYI